ncbi:hypothetical protein SK128_007046 [Halocaridina rubra]|uniref:Uncharacterized protein n=1 Tax=Halocaridina rubra TaxID=373956 RepID=A0AAN8WRZ6_HALRR
MEHYRRSTQIDLIFKIKVIILIGALLLPASLFCFMYGFTALLDYHKGPGRAQCMTCHFIICNSNLKPSRL